MSEWLVVGAGAVSPAGWGVAALTGTLAAGEPLPTAALPRPGWSQPLQVRRVPPPPARPAFLAHPRLRRASPVSHFAVAATLEAIGADPSRPPVPMPEPERVGLVFCTMTGSVVYSRRFFEEVRHQPATASPLLFPETVFNAPASHVATLLGLSGRVHTEVGDATCFFAGLATATLWLGSGAVDLCLVVAAEESDWLVADGLALRRRSAVAAEGSGALLLARQDDRPDRPALARLRAVIEPGFTGDPDTLSNRLGAPGSSSIHAVREAAAGKTFPTTERHSEPQRLDAVEAILGEGWAAGSAWRCLAALVELGAFTTASPAGKPPKEPSRAAVAMTRDARWGAGACFDPVDRIVAIR